MGLKEWFGWGKRRQETEEEFEQEQEVLEEEREDLAEEEDAPHDVQGDDKTVAETKQTIDPEKEDASPSTDAVEASEAAETTADQQEDTEAISAEQGAAAEEELGEEQEADGVFVDDEDDDANIDEFATDATFIEEQAEEAMSVEESEQLDEAEQEEPSEKAEKKGFFSRLASGLKKTTDNLSQVFASVFSGSEINDDFYEELEEALIIADVGMETTSIILDRLRTLVKEEKITDPQQAREVLTTIVADLMQAETPFIQKGEKAVILIVGVNGVGKTTSIGKLSHLYKQQGWNVMLAAGDTFRAAATEQLCEWSDRAGVPIVKQKEGADPAAVVYDAIQSAKAKNMDLLIVDTAGRLHNKKNLMDELQKIRRVIAKEFGDARVESLLVLDATTGQNGLSQARIFAETVDVTGIILSKLDGTAKGGVAVAVRQETGIPVRFVGVGEKIDDLQDFDAHAYAEALFQ